MAKKGEKTQMLDDALRGVRRAIATQFKSARALAEESGVNAPNLTRWLSESQYPDFNSFSHVLMRIGARLVFPDESSYSTEYSGAPVIISDFDKALADVLSGLLTVHNLTHEKAASSLWPETANGAAKLGRILTAKEPLTPEVLMQLCLLMEEDPGKLLRLARERVQPEGEQISGNAKSA